MNNLLAVIALSAITTAAVCAGADDAAPRAAGSASSTASAPQQGKAACELLTGPDVEAVFGAPARPSDELNRDSQCTYWAPQTGASGVTLRLTPGREFHSSWASDQMRSMSEIEDVAGLGEAAVWVADMRTLVMLAGDQTHVLLGSGALDAKRQLMERILARR